MFRIGFLFAQYISFLVINTIGILILVNIMPANAGYGAIIYFFIYFAVAAIIISAIFSYTGMLYDTRFAKCLSPTRAARHFFFRFFCTLLIVIVSIGCCFYFGQIKDQTRTIQLLLLVVPFIVLELLVTLTSNIHRYNIKKLENKAMQMLQKNENANYIIKKIKITRKELEELEQRLIHAKNQENDL